jgi:alkylation response protein AidB-like acyl-CoA dehydrogenase
MATSLEASRLLVRSAAAALDARSPRATLAAAMAKRSATDACFGVANDALQMLGGYGYLQVRRGRRGRAGSRPLVSTQPGPLKQHLV